MKRIGITQRVEVFSDYDERRDSLDESWTSLFEMSGLDLIPIPNTHQDVSSWIMRQNLDGLLLSGGNDLAHLPEAQNVAPERDNCEWELLHWANKTSIPVLGVCRGMQIMNCYLGGQLSSLTGHVASNHQVLKRDEDKLFSNFTNVNSYHNWGINLNGLGTDLLATLIAPDATVEAFKHTIKPWYGVMWHPSVPI